MTDPLSVGVIGVGRMGHHHARVYQELPNVDLVGNDVDTQQAATVDPTADRELAASVEVVQTNRDPTVSMDDGVRALELVTHSQPVATGR